MICLGFIFQMLIDLIKENGFKLKKKALSRQHSAKTITDANFAEDLVLLANTPAQAEFFVHILEQVAGSIGLLMNANKTVHMF